MNPTQEQPNPGALADLTPADILRCAARYIELHGWNQGTYYALTDDDNPFPPACVSAAIGMATHGHRMPVPHDFKTRSGARDYSRALDALTCYLLATAPDPVRICDDDDVPTGDPFEWNDHSGRTAEQVITTLRAAAGDYDWTHATEDDLETYADACVWAEKHPTREGFLAWLGAR
ncbi:hypothetical protein AB0L34_21740 [Micromonospora sp. NPDC052213]|uniref:DUF6197 family protein n=1 Tax=Micromonospora sp. NPDC052213 TaxID=3155812 RepID=UPI00343834FD